VIRFTRVCKRYGSTAALEDIDWEVEAGERVVVLGHSGAGKTTLLRLLSMETPPTSGSVQVGSYLSGKLSGSKKRLLRRSLGIIFEDVRLLPDRTVHDNLALVLNVAGDWDHKQVDKRVCAALDEVGAEEQAALYPAELSAGERQRVAVARALVREPLLLIADEPTGNLELESAFKVLDALKSANQRGVTVVLSTNDPARCERFDGRVTRLAAGRIPEAGNG
jgi:cell division transport system ATP-binding protein